MDGWMDGWIDGWMDGWIDRRIGTEFLNTVVEEDERDLSGLRDNLNQKLFCSYTDPRYSGLMTGIATG
jgi:hypothetical protein